MDSPYIGAIFIWAGNFAPRDYLFCQGQTLPIQQYTALYSILGTVYGGNGTTTFMLPDLRGRLPLGAGQGLGLPPQVIGAIGGSPSVTLGLNNLPAHNHAATFTGTGGGSAAGVKVSTAPATLATPEEHSYLAVAGGSRPTTAYIPNGSQGTTVDLGGVSGGGITGGTVAVASTGNNVPFDNHPPFLALNFIIAINGLYPPRN